MPFLRAGVHVDPGWLCRRTGAQTRCTCSRCRWDDSHTPPWRCSVKLTGDGVPLKWPQEARNRFSSHGRWWGRRQASFPEVITHAETWCHFHHIEWFCASVSKPKPKSDQMASGAALRLLYVRGLQTRSPARSCCCAASRLNTSAPLDLCFRFPLPAHDCLTMGGNGS